MWIHLCLFLHVSNSEIHSLEKEVIDQAIHQEHMIGRNRFEEDYEYLF